MPRILIVYASVGTGHRRAALALAAAFARKPHGEVRVEDALAYGGRVFQRAYTQTYLDLTEHAPTLWRLFYEGTNSTDPEWVALANRLRSLVEGMGVTHLERLVRRFAPAAIVCTHFLPVDPADPQRIFSWLICESYDDKGNVIAYEYKSEDAIGVSLAQANERNRVRTANRYLKRIRYGNHTPYFPILNAGASWPSLPNDDSWYFEVVFDYGEHDQANPKPDDATAWSVRNDSFSSRAHFSIASGS